MTDERAVRATVAYYSSTGNVHALAEAVAEGAAEAGAEVRFRRVAELAPDEAIDANPDWRAHLDATADVAEATVDDLAWADAIFLGTPTRFGNIAAQLKQLLDQCGPLWSEGQLVDKVASGFCSVSTPHGGHESTLLALYNTMYHWGCLIVTPGYVDTEPAGNPYGTSHTSGDGSAPGRTELQAARFQAHRAVEIAAQLRRGRIGRVDKASAA